MCGTSMIGGAGAMAATQMPARKLVTGGGDAAPGATAGAGSIPAMLQQLLSAVQALTAAISGGVAAAGGGAAQIGTKPPAGGATGVPIQAAVHGAHDHGPSMPATASIAQYGTGADTSIEAGSKTNVSNGKGDWKRIYARPAEDRTKGAASLKTMMDSTAAYKDINAAKAAGYDFSKAIVEGALVHVPNPTFAKQYGGADLSHPSMLLYRKVNTGSGYELIGNVMTASKQAPDLGMGNWHTHQKAGTAGGNTDLMMHVWFLPQNLDAAYSETFPKG